MRTALILLLCLLLPLQGLALARAVDQHCPMGQQQAAIDHHGDQHGCCEDDDGAQAERRCQHGQQCHGGSYSLPMPAPLPLFAPPLATVAVASSHAPPPVRPDRVWRPPAFG